MAKFCFSGKDTITGQFFYMNEWRGLRCLCGFDINYFLGQLAWYQQTGYKEMNDA